MVFYQRTLFGWLGRTSKPKPSFCKFPKTASKNAFRKEKATNERPEELMI